MLANLRQRFQVFVLNLMRMGWDTPVQTMLKGERLGRQANQCWAAVGGNIPPWSVNLLTEAPVRCLQEVFHHLSGTRADCKMKDAAN
jgi:hypothetical protein